MVILGISAFYHDSAACILVDGELVAAVQEERFTRIKNDASFPIHSIEFCIGNLKGRKVDIVTYYEKPLLKFERIIQTHYRFAPLSIKTFLKGMPVWLTKKLFLKSSIKKSLFEISKDVFSDFRFTFPSHHLSHSASAYFASGYNDSAIITVDGVGEWQTLTISKARGNEITVLKEINYPHSLGLFYSSVTYFLGFKVNKGEYKVMGLAPYGNSSSDFYKTTKIRLRQIIDSKEDGSFWLNQKFFAYNSTMKMIDKIKWEKLFELQKVENTQELSQEHCDFALACQHLLEDIMMKLAKYALSICNTKNLCLSGGVALNSVANGKVETLQELENLFVQPASGDAGGAIGAAFITNSLFKEEIKMKTFSCFLGPEYSDEIIQKVLDSKGVNYKKQDDNSLNEIIAQKISEGKVVGWFQGKMEFGPRALGNRSILGDPRSVMIKSKINKKVKFRESFRPFAPAVLEEDLNKFFDMKSASPYMLLVKPIKMEYRLSLNEKDLKPTLNDKSIIASSNFPSITHIDYSCRIQSVNENQNPKFYKLLNEFKKQTGVGMLLNTSFNIGDEPIVNTPEEALRSFYDSGLEVLVLNNFIIEKETK